ncbi:MAG TPA: hypothetical protein VFN42_04965, partial [Acetobacteraceae bacterium]|nr:hypothetical protein [Acetobacteraceae bacterium]
WNHALPGITRAVIVIHGYLRNADAYYAVARQAVALAGPAGAGSILIAPQFLVDRDIAAHRLPPDVLRWSLIGWERGDNAQGPAPISSFAALDAIMGRLGDRRRFPDLHSVVIAGHSGGAQVVQRYAILGRGSGLLPAGVAVRFVVANPSSYAWFNTQRPNGKGGFAPFDAASCPRFNQWKYGMTDLPPYGVGADADALERAYLARDVIYLLGTADTNPRQPALDRSCMAEAQGPNRLARGLAYVRYLRGHGGSAFHQHVLLVPGVGHNARRMLTSACGLAALFDRPGCASGR